MARPSKIEPFLKVAEQVVSEDINAIIFTDEELVDAINERLEENQRITYRTFRNWKSDAINGTDEHEFSQRFFLLIKRALREQKQSLFEKFRTDKSQWQRWAWIIERKFDEWNVKHKTEHSGEIKLPALTVEVVKNEGQ